MPRDRRFTLEHSSREPSHPPYSLASRAAAGGAVLVTSFAFLHYIRFTCPHPSHPRATAWQLASVRASRNGRLTPTMHNGGADSTQVRLPGRTDTRIPVEPLPRKRPTRIRHPPSPWRHPRWPDTLGNPHQFAHPLIVQVGRTGESGSAPLGRQSRMTCSVAIRGERLRCWD